MLLENVKPCEPHLLVFILTYSHPDASAVFFIHLGSVLFGHREVPEIFFKQ